MQVKLPGGWVMVCGHCSKDGELQRVGEKQSRLCKVGVAVDKRPDPENPSGKPVNVWANVTAWHDLASVLARVKKGDSILVIGRVKSREYEGKEYKDLEADWIGVSALPPAASNSSHYDAPVPAGDQFTELDDDDGELPF